MSSLSYGNWSILAADTYHDLLFTYSILQLYNFNKVLINLAAEPPNPHKQSAFHELIRRSSGECMIEWCICLMIDPQIVQHCENTTIKGNLASYTIERHERSLIKDWHLLCMHGRFCISHYPNNPFFKGDMINLTC